MVTLIMMDKGGGSATKISSFGKPYIKISIHSRFGKTAAVKDAEKKGRENRRERGGERKREAKERIRGL